MAAFSETMRMSLLLMLISLPLSQSIGNSLQASKEWADIEESFMNHGTSSTILKRANSEDLAFRGLSLLQSESQTAITEGPPMQRDGVMDSLLHSFLLMGSLTSLVCIALYWRLVPSKSESTITTPLLRQQTWVIPRASILIGMIAFVLLSSMLLRWGLAGTFNGCFVWDTLPMAIIVNHYKKTKPEYVSRYTNQTWDKRAWLGAHNPTKNPSQVFDDMNAHRNQCSNRGYAASHVADIMLSNRHVPIQERAQSIKGPFCIGNVCKPHFLTIMAIMRGEKEAVVEWVDFHMQVGADHFLLYMDESGSEASSLRALLQPWTEAGVVTLLDGSEGGQGKADMRSVQEFFQTTWWLARLDLDEFMHAGGFHARDGFRVDNYLARLSSPKNLPTQLLLPRFDFGDSGWDAKPAGLTTKAYDRAESMASIFKPLIFTPIFEKPGVLDKLGGNPHKFLDQSIAVSCEAILWLGPFLWCPKNEGIYFVGWDNPLSSHKKI